MNQLSTLPFLAAALGAFWVWLATSSFRHRWIGAKGFAWVIGWLAALGAWGVTTSHLAIAGNYETQEFYSRLPGLWLPLVPIALTVFMVLASSSLRHALLTIASRHTRAMVLIHALRIAALGSIYKASIGAFPAFFAYFVGFPDFLFGLSALALGLSGKWNVLGPRGLIVWNLIGIAVILPAPILIQLGLPGPVHTFTSLPDGRALLEFPMVLAPTLVVAFFITMNAIQAAAAWLGYGADGHAPSNPSDGLKERARA
ncbi:MAG: hypothetical protein ACTSSR_07275 [Alphaproteobacteria bacterium]